MAEPFLLLLLLPLLSLAQQTYVNNEQLDCNFNHTASLGYLCNAPSASCASFLTFRSSPTYNTPVSIAYLLSADASQIVSANNISDVDRLPDDTLVVVPVNCSCSGAYYQHNASYVLKHRSETYLTVANDTYQSLTTCHSMKAQNPYDYLRLYPGLRLNAPLRCACPTSNQTAAGFRYLLTYLIRQGNSYESIADEFAGAGADVQGILDANLLTVNHLIYFFTPILVPLKIEPTKENINLDDSPLPPPVLPAAPPAGGGGSGKWVFIGVGIGAAVLVVLLSAFAVWFFRYRRRESPPYTPPKLVRESGEAAPFSGRSVSSEGIRNATETLTVYKFEELEKATGSFAESNRIDGSSAYLGSFKGDNAVVKMMEGDVSREIEALRQINHSHIIRLSGYCLHEGITYLVYEYAENGSLSEWLHPHNKDSSYQHKDSPLVIRDSRRLDWKQRVQIAYDVADALNYLHNFTSPPYIYNNLKSSNVLLDGHMRAKIANFGLARVLDGDSDGTVVMTRHVVGTHGYMAPEYIESGLVTPKLDVFALGVVMLELLSGREPVEGKNVERKDGGGGGGKLLSESIGGVLGGENVREKLRGFVDPWLGEEYPAEMAYAMAWLAMSCVADKLDERPAVSEVFLSLSKLLSSSLDWDPSHDTSLTLSD